MLAPRLHLLGGRLSRPETTRSLDKIHARAMRGSRDAPRPAMADPVGAQERSARRAAAQFLAVIDDLALIVATRLFHGASWQPATSRRAR